MGQGATNSSSWLKWILLTHLSCLALVSGKPTPQTPEQTQASRSSDGDEFMLLSQDEIVEQANILRYLDNASKEEVEEILEQNPELQQKLLSRVRKVVRTKERKKTPVAVRTDYLEGSSAHRPMDSVVQEEQSMVLEPPEQQTMVLEPPEQQTMMLQQQVQQSIPPPPLPGIAPGGGGSNFGNDYVYDYEDLDNSGLGIDQTALMQAKFKDKATRWVRIGKGLASKLKALRGSKKAKQVGGNGKPQRPVLTHTHKDYHFHFDVNKSSDKLS